LKPLDVQAAIGRAQLKRLAAFGEARRSNWNYLRQGLAELGDFFEFSLPTHATGWSAGQFSWADTGSDGARSDPSWFGFMLLVREGAPFSVGELARALDENKIGNRRLFGGNLVRQPAFVQLRRDKPQAFRVVGELRGADRLMSSALFVGVYPGLTQRMLEFVVSTITDFCRIKVRRTPTYS
jgi:CDP-6-deoxy-D-xylo-4-hexulose-3-dehydrase